MRARSSLLASWDFGLFGGRDSMASFDSVIADEGGSLYFQGELV